MLDDTYPWTIKLCTGPALQFMIVDCEGSIVMMAEMYDEEALMRLLNLFSRNEEIVIDKDFQATLDTHKINRFAEDKDIGLALAEAVYMKAKADKIPMESIYQK